MDAKIKVHGKAQSRTVLGIVNAYIALNPDTDLAKLNEAFPATLHSGKKDSLFADPDEVIKEGKLKDYFEHEDERVTLPNGTVLAMVEKWIKDDYDKVIELAKGYGIIAVTESTGAFERGTYELEYLDKKEEEKECVDCSWKSWLKPLIILAALLILAFLLCKFCSKDCECNLVPATTTEAVAQTANTDAGLTAEELAAKEAQEAAEKAAKEAAEKTAALKKAIEGKSIRFKKASADLTADSDDTINTIAEFLKANPNSTLEVIGHASPEGPAEYNQILSEKRAQAVVDSLIKKGIPASQLEAKGVGAGQQISGGDDANRSVEFRIK